MFKSIINQTILICAIFAGQFNNNQIPIVDDRFSQISPLTKNFNKNNIHFK